MKLIIIAFIFLITGCHTLQHVNWPQRTSSLTGTAFYQAAFVMKWASRDSFVLAQVEQGNLPSFLRKFTAIHTSIIDTVSGQAIKALYFVSTDYLSVGTDDDWARINITPYTAQRIADMTNCFLPTRKISDDIFKQATVKLEPVPMYAFRDSTPTMWHHHLIIEGQRKKRKGLVAGIKKDVVISGKLATDKRSDRVAIYGWHKPDGKPIQPVYTGHIYWWVDYSQGIRLVYRKIKVNGRWMDYEEILKHPVLNRLLCDEDNCDYSRYPVK
jgi:hypothetical protein